MAAPQTPILDNFNRADSASLGSAWSSPGSGMEESLRIGGNYCRVPSDQNPASSYWNTLLNGSTECYYTMSGTGQNCHLLIGWTATGYFYKIRNDMNVNIIEMTRWEASSEALVLFQNNDHKTGGPNSKMWVTMMPDPGGSGGTQLTLYFSADGGTTWTQYAQVVDTKAFPTSSYIGIRLVQNGQVDDFGGGPLGVTAQSAVAISNLVAPVPTLSKAQQQPVPVGISTLTRVSPGQTMAPVIGPAVMTLVRGTQGSRMQANVPPGLETISRPSPTGSTTVPPFPPIPAPPPPPPPPPPDPRDIPAVDGPWTYMMYDAMQPLTWADESLGWPMLWYFKAIAYNYHEPYEFAVDPGWELALNVDEVPSWWLNWLAQFVGIPVLTFALLDSQTKRNTIKDAPGWHRGTLAAMINAAKGTLSGNQTVICYERYNPTVSGDQAYHITFITYQSETPNQSVTLAALMAAKPGGIQLSLLSRAGQIWQWLRDHYPPTTQRTWAQVKSEYPDWEHARDVTYY